MFLSKTKVATERMPKKLGLVAILIAGSMFAASFDNISNEELYKMIDRADSRTLSEISFEIHKRAGKLSSEAMDIRNGFRVEMQKKMSAMSSDDRVKFMQEYRDLLGEKIDDMSVKDAKSMGFFGNMGGKKGSCGNKGFGNCQKANGGCGMMGAGQGNPNQGFGMGQGARQGQGMRQGGCMNQQGQGFGMGQGQGRGFNQWQGTPPCMQQ